DAVAARALAAGTTAEATPCVRDALAGFDDAAITTIHGFCLRVLREHALDCGAELDAELLTDDTELLDAVVRDFWTRETSRRPVALVEALVTRGKLGLDTLRALARRAVRHPDAAVVPAPDALEEASLEVAVEERARLAVDLAGQWEGDVVSEALHAIEEARAEKRLSGVKWKPDSAVTRWRAVALWAAGDPATAELPEKELAYFGTAALQGAANKNKTAPEHPLFDHVDALLEADRAVHACAVNEALRLRHACARFAREETARRKRLARCHGFDDLLRLVRDAVGGEGALVDALRAGYRAALIDEFQDTDDVQWEVFRRAFADSPSHRLVLIGDPKQSIYAFRGADVDTYLRARGAAATRWALDVNWRTDRALVDALQALWGAHPAPFARPGIGWRPITAHHGERRLAGAGAGLRVRLLTGEGPFTPTGTRTRITKGRLDERLPALVASDVARFLGSGATIAERVGGAERRRAVRPADVAVLVRTNRQALAVLAALRAAGVPAVMHGAESVFASREAEELAAVLAAVLEPASAPLARAALATDLLGVAAAEELAPGEGIGPGDVLARLDEGADAHADLWAERLRRWRAAWRVEGAGRAGAPTAASAVRLVRALLEELALPERLLALADGERRLTNLLHLAELLHVAATERALAPGATLAWLREQVANCGAARDDAARQLRLESDAAAAQVVTVHSSKGLEYGAVWCPYLWDGRSAPDADLLYPCVPAADGDSARVIDLRASRETPAGARVEDERFAESLRLAYVALTRARHQVTLWWGAATDFETSPLAWLLHGGDAADAAEARASVGARVGTLEDAAPRARVEAL
ncbi:UvrD-helicase domain-containing protein, partial [Roseisolibacter sp. H3M3-2]|uniref:UvrD-helicase domain-containing protein n=1 Tax=Roseisolibacter sp. H3M3-2 TaxID=3031323 RepID=UPI0023DBD37F